MADKDLVVTSITCILFTVVSFFTLQETKLSKRIPSYSSRDAAGLLHKTQDGRSAENSTRSTHFCI